ncbi:hypothetical protein Dda_3674 [Drechslerella dactyloides]|uniref:Wax synthase domain-containing protein n=1 Tax=Drechslerella dactyloides TaxID=74499 RepID=A0AAD6NJS4_DREDA|nr:hypothetical protein Dda_3674 [Drechslerella dactyloides]
MPSLDMTVAGTASQPGGEDSINVAFRDVPRALWCILGCFALLYTANYHAVARNSRRHVFWSVVTLMAVVFSHFYAKIDCRPWLALRNCAFSCCFMKCLDMLFRRFQNTTLTWKLPTPSSTPPPLYQQAFWMTLELRYEHFTPNPVRIPVPAPFHEPTQWLYHLLVYAIITFGPLPQDLSIVKAVKLLLQIYIIWTAMHLPLRLLDTAPFFAPLYTADSLVKFWNGTVWHVAFQSPCRSVAMVPVQTLLTGLGTSRSLARGAGVIAAFALMGVFHAYIGWAVMRDSVYGWGVVVGFFVMNGIATVLESVLWGRRRSWVRAVLAWGFEIALASWAMSGVEFPRELWRVHDPLFCHISVL